MAPLYLNPSNACSLDIETNNLLEPMIDFSKGFPLTLTNMSKLWVISIHDLTTDKVVSIKHRDIKRTRLWLKSHLSKYDVILTHNGIKFDLPTLKLFGLLDYEVGYGKYDTLFGRQVILADTLILSRFENPDRPLGHSLKQWGIRVSLDKIDYRQYCLEQGIIEHGDPKGSEFKVFDPEMISYCETDAKVTSLVYKNLVEKLNKYKDTDYRKALRIEHKLADLGIKRELFGFDFDEDKAIECLHDLGDKIDEIRKEVNPYLPPKPFNQSELKEWTLPAKQLTNSNELTAHMINFLKKHDLKPEVDLSSGEIKYYFIFKDTRYNLPYDKPLKTERKADISDLDHVKQYLLDQGWVPVEWGLTDLTKASDKKAIPLEKRVERFKRYLKDMYAGKYRKERTAELGIENTKEGFQAYYAENIQKLTESKPFMVPTSPKIKVGVTKDLCPNLEKLSKKVPFVANYADYLAYRHRRSVIASKNFSPNDYPDEVPEKGLLNSVRVDGRISTPSIEIGAISHRYRHITVANIPRASSLYGKEMRSLFRAGNEYIQLGFDFSSLENRVQGGYVKSYPGGEEYAIDLEAEKPNDLHSKNAIKLGISRTDAKSFAYAVLYGAFINKLKKMLGKTYEETEIIYNTFWNNAPALKNFKQDLEKEWQGYSKKYIIGVDGRHILVRSSHSILNSLFQSAGIICAKYTTVKMFELLEKQGVKINPFECKPDVCGMIEYHDECQIAIKKSLNLLEFKIFDTKDEAENFKKEQESLHGLQLSTVKKAHKSDRYFVTLPSLVSIAIEEATKWTQEVLNLQFELGFEYDIGKNWYETH